MYYKSKLLIRAILLSQILVQSSDYELLLKQTKSLYNIKTLCSFQTYVITTWLSID